MFKFNSIFSIQICKGALLDITFRKCHIKNYLTGNATNKINIAMLIKFLKAQILNLF